MIAPFERAKFQELLLYVARESEDDVTFGSVKLHKILAFADFKAYAELGHAITNARYQRLPWGPAARASLPAQEELIRNGDADLESRVYFGHRQTRLVPRREPDISYFGRDELAIVDRVLKDFAEFDGAMISQMSHNGLKGWQVAEDGEDIPYATIFVSPEDDPPAEAIAVGQRIAAELGLTEK